MDVYLVPASPSRYSLYCETPMPVDDLSEPDEPRTFVERLKASFRRAVDEGEAQQRGDGDPNRGRLRRFITRKIAEAVTEQRLLWSLRHETTARLVHPDTLDGAAALALSNAEFKHDYARHRRWMVIDGLLVATTGPLLFFVPGPNLVSWYFTFRAVGHFFSMRGAQRAVAGIEWTPLPSAPLTDVAAALLLEGEAREQRICAAAEALGLDRLPAFVERIADRPA